MSHASLPSQPGSNVHDPARRPAFRLSDAEKIASVRLDTTGDGSLKEALAEAQVSAPRDEVDHLTSRIELAQAAYAPPIPSSTIPVLADPPIVVSDTVDFTIPEWSDARGVMLAELHQQSMTPPEEAPQPTHWQPATRDAEPYTPPVEITARPPMPPSPPPMTMAEPPPPEPPQPPYAEAPYAEAPYPEAPYPEAPHPEPPRPEPAHPEPPPARADVGPIANALDAAAKLTADATATAAALEKLTRLLEQHRLATQAAPDAPVAQVRPQQRPTPRPAANMGHRQPQAQVAPVALKSRPAPAARPIKPPALRPLSPVRDAQFDLRGFLAGFAVSCAIGAVIYIYLIGGG